MLTSRIKSEALLFLWMLKLFSKYKNRRSVKPPSTNRRPIGNIRRVNPSSFYMCRICWAGAEKRVMDRSHLGWSPHGGNPNGHSFPGSELTGHRALIGRAEDAPNAKAQNIDDGLNRSLHNVGRSQNCSRNFNND